MNHKHIIWHAVIVSFILAMIPIALQGIARVLHDPGAIFITWIPTFIVALAINYITGRNFTPSRMAGNVLWITIGGFIVYVAFFMIGFGG